MNKLKKKKQIIKFSKLFARTGFSPIRSGNISIRHNEKNLKGLDGKKWEISKPMPSLRRRAKKQARRPEKAAASPKPAERVAAVATVISAMISSAAVKLTVVAAVRAS